MKTMNIAPSKLKKVGIISALVLILGLGSWFVAIQYKEFKAPKSCGGDFSYNAQCPLFTACETLNEGPTAGGVCDPYLTPIFVNVLHMRSVPQKAQHTTSQPNINKPKLPEDDSGTVPTIDSAGYSVFHVLGDKQFGFKIKYPKQVFGKYSRYGNTANSAKADIEYQWATSQNGGFIIVVSYTKELYIDSSIASKIKKINKNQAKYSLGNNLKCAQSTSATDTIYAATYCYAQKNAETIILYADIAGNKSKYAKEVAQILSTLQFISNQ